MWKKIDLFAQTTPFYLIAPFLELFSDPPPPLFLENLET